MTIKDEVLEDLRKGVPFAEIRGKYRSQSALYEAIREFLEEAEEIVEEMQKKLGKLKTDLAGTRTELERVNREREKVSAEVQELVQAEEKLEEEVARKTAELDRLNAGIEELRAKRFTPEIMSEITAIESRSGPDLLRQIETVEEYKQIKREVSNLKKSKAALEGTGRNLSAKKEKLEKKLRSQRNQLDELRLRTATFREAVTIVCSLFKDDYSTADIESLKHGLDMLGIRGNPLLSVTRLVNGLSKYKNLVALEDKVQVCEKELETLKTAIVDAESELKVVKQLTKAFNEVKDAGGRAIDGTAEHAKRGITHVAGVSEKHMTASVDKFNAHIQRTMEGVRAGLGEWGELQEQKGRIKELIHPALVLLGILNSPEYLRQLPLTNVLQLFDRLHSYSEMKLKDVFIKPSQDIWRKDVNLNPLNSYRLPVLIEFVCEGLREIMIQQSRKE